MVLLELVCLLSYSAEMQAGHIENISFLSVALVNVQVRNVTVEVTIGNGKKKKSKGADVEAGARKVKKILDGISADFLSGTLCGIIGGSGSGKTTLLNLMAHCMRLEQCIWLDYVQRILVTILYNPCLCYTNGPAPPHPHRL
ncbi:hypothetical protein AAF712_003792 [Marasmius tenuissimus]|uniref:ABC transporter domain-containing protein n=1 Tax=Marasmius tenuissimus TaxID=585030 RepID=A0ABR3A701_9AGAR